MTKKLEELLNPPNPQDIVKEEEKKEKKVSQETGKRKQHSTERHS